MIQGDNWVFIHNPKCAGTSVKHIVSKYGERYRGHSHIGYEDLSPEEQNKFVFTFVRNPYDRLVSMYEFARHKIATTDTTQYGWIHGIKDANRPFKEWLMDSELWENNYGRDHLLPVQKRSQQFFVGEADYVGKVETFSDDMRKICAVIGVPFKEDHRNITEHAEYRTYYDKESIAWIEKWFAWELDKFDYTF